MAQEQKPSTGGPQADPLGCGRPLDPGQRLYKSCQTNDEFEVVPFFGLLARLNALWSHDHEVPVVREGSGGQDAQAAILQRRLPEQGVAEEKGTGGGGGVSNFGT